MPNVIRLLPTQVGLIVRGKIDHNHEPGKLEQHADCVLPNGVPVGFFGGGGDASSGSFASITNSFSGWADGPSGVWNSVGLNMKGFVAYYEDFQKMRPAYVDLNLAIKYKTVSTLLIINVNETQAGLFQSYWEQLRLNPGAFNILGGNCSTHASEAFRHAHILNKGIPGLDTPNNLYQQLFKLNKESSQSVSGHVGFRLYRAGHYEILVS